MLPNKIDEIFPIVVFLYGFLLVFVIENRWLEQAQGQFAISLRQHLASKKAFAWTCFFVGGLWSLQIVFI